MNIREGNDMHSETHSEGGGGGRARRGAAALDLGAFVTGVLSAVAWTVRDEVEPHGINPLEFAVLRALQYSETSTATQLARLLTADPTRISRAVNNLVSGRLLRRRRERSDRRVVTLEMTDEGVDLVRDLSQRVERRYEELLEGVTPDDMRTFMAIGETIMQNRRTARGAQ
ncbi:MAG: winged helix-turn-helix transcriptional regulator [Acidobacteria bacterium]|nr:winged helix-turn-helix transcriptional regulator [Acidobacteriota bacterium]